MAYNPQVDTRHLVITTGSDFTLYGTIVIALGFKYHLNSKPETHRKYNPLMSGTGGIYKKNLIGLHIRKAS